MPPAGSCLMSKAARLWHHSAAISQTIDEWGPRVSLVCDRGPAARAQDENWLPPLLTPHPPPFLFKKKKRSPAAPPRLPCDSPERTSVAAPDLCPRPPALRPIYSSLSLPTPKSQPAPSPPPRPLLWSAKVLLRRWRRDRQRDRRLQSRVRSTSSHDRHMKGCFPEREPNGRDPSKGPVLLFLINTPKKKNPTRLQHLFLFPQSLVLQRLEPQCRNFAVARCQRLAGGRKRGGRKHRLAGLNCSSGHPAFRSGPARSLTSLPPGRLSARRNERFEGATSSWQSAALSCATDI